MRWRGAALRRVTSPQKDHFTVRRERTPTRAISAAISAAGLSVSDLRVVLQVWELELRVGRTPRCRSWGWAAIIQVKGKTKC